MTWQDLGHMYTHLAREYNLLLRFSLSVVSLLSHIMQRASPCNLFDMLHVFQVGVHEGRALLGGALLSCPLPLLLLHRHKTTTHCCFCCAFS